MRNPVFSNPAIPAKLILDPWAPVPASMSKVNRKRLQELREAYQASIAENLPKIQIKTPEVAVEVLVPVIGHMAVECLAVLCLNIKAKLIGPPVIISRGDIDGTEAGPRPVLRAVLVAEAASFILGHNHPTGDVSPSPADLAVTKNMAKAAKVVGCDLFDHVIVNRRGEFISLRRDHPDLWA